MEVAALPCMLLTLLVHIYHAAQIGAHTIYLEGPEYPEYVMHFFI